MQRHRLSPEQAYILSEWEEINHHAWMLRRITGNALKQAISVSVEERLRTDVTERVEFLQRKHRGKEL